VVGVVLVHRGVDLATASIPLVVLRQRLGETSVGSDEDGLATWLAVNGFLGKLLVTLQHTRVLKVAGRTK